MKLFDCDWSAIAASAPKWDALPLSCKGLFLKHVEPNKPLLVERIRIDYQPLVKTGFLEPASDEAAGIRLRAEHISFRRAVRAMARHRIAHPAYEKEIGLAAYLQEHFTSDERVAMAGARHAWDGTGASLAVVVGQPSWLRRFLDEPDFNRWETGHGDRRGQPLFVSPVTFDRAKTILRAIMADEIGFPSLTDIPAALGVENMREYGTALRALIGYALIFPTLLEPDLRIGLGIWPASHRRLHRAPATAPAPVTPKESYHGAFLVDDMTTILVACAAEPLRLRRQDGMLFAKTCENLARRLAALPDWLLGLLPIGEEERLRVAQETLWRLGLTRAERSSKADPELTCSAQGAAWLRGGDADRLRHVLCVLREDAAAEAGLREDYGWTIAPRLHFLSRLPPIRLGPAVVDCRPALIAAFAGLPRDAHVRWSAFLDHQATESNPYIALHREREDVSRMADGCGPPGTVSEEDLERSWRSVLERFLVDRLLPLGGVAMGIAAEGKATVSLAEPGEFLLGRREEFAWGIPAGREIVVQPNLEITFLAPNPAGEAVAARFAERVGHKIGVLFRVTRRSIHGAFAAGWDAEAVLARLRELSSKPIPDNVTEQIRGWSAQCRRVEVSTAVLFRCPDRETSLRVLAAGGKALTLVSDTVVALSDRKALKAVEKKLRQQGITTVS